MPHLQKVLAKYQSKGFAVLAINVYPDQDKEAEGIMERNRFTMTLLKTPSGEWAKKVYGLKSTPETYLLDAEGRAIFRPFHISGEHEQRIFELQVEALLRRASVAPATERK